MTKSIAIDCMGADLGPSVIVDACQQALAEDPDLFLYLVGDSAELESCLSHFPDVDRSRLTLQHASEVISMEDKPSSVLRRKLDASMRVALELVRDGRAAACVSAGNTGALLALSILTIRTLPGIDRPAIIAELPGKQSPTFVLDLGANIECQVKHLQQFALMGSALVGATQDVSEPVIALLNVGEEDVKGNQVVKQTAELLEADPELNYQGFIEGYDLFDNSIDVVVCDGFTGNNVLKACEGITRFIYDQMMEEFSRSWRNKLAAQMVKPVLKSFQARINPNRYNGASLLGLRDIVVKSHSTGDAEACLHAIRKARDEIDVGVPTLIRQKIESAKD